ncbi:hypothetical protein [Leeuwenhoekiella sp. MAR_2009_132]|uniref:hypothetical protein n=1 Tax=Leeuwenhoekiella sp. MAR_2009_132 TaxID=1392489 RepID=UPI0004916063|nr:hypothetical protein [Leeuwenhoekiella sp. MAR_2009_132]
MNREQLLQEIEKEFGPGCAAICKERARQKEVKGYDVEKDLKTYYENEELANASAAYAVTPATQMHHFKRSSLWPWSPDMYNETPLNRQREFEKSGALMAAQLDVTISKNQKICQQQ